MNPNALRQISTILRLESGSYVKNAGIKLGELKRLKAKGMFGTKQQIPMRPVSEEMDADSTEQDSDDTNEVTNINDDENSQASIVSDGESSSEAEMFSLDEYNDIINDTQHLTMTQLSTKIVFDSQETCDLS
jgi:hypothetical protein